MTTEIVYRGHKGEHREYYICTFCGTAFYNDTFTTIEGPKEVVCPVCENWVKEVDKELFESYVKSHNDLTESISTEGCADRAPNGTDEQAGITLES